MATAIVESAAPEDIPEAPINILRDVVSLRKKSARFFGKLAKDSKDETIKAKNATHEHIINVLDRVLRKFEAMVSQVRGKGKTPSGNININDLSNMFEHLKVQDAEPDAEGDDEEVSDDESRTGGKSRTKPKKKNGAKKKNGRRSQASSRSGARASSGNTVDGSGPLRREPGRNWIDDVQFDTAQFDADDELDYYMLVYCFFEDFNTIRGYVCERWCDYFYDNSVSLNTLAVITNAACEFFKQMEVDLLHVVGVRNRKMVEFETMAKMLFLDAGLEHIDYDSYDDLTDGELDDTIYSQEADWLAHITFWDMRECLEQIPPGKVPTILPSLMKQPRDKYGATSARDRRAFVKSVIMEYMQEAATVKSLKQNRLEGMILPAEPEPLLGFQRALKHKALPTHVVFSMQLYVDIRAIMEDRVGDAFVAMQETARWVDRTMEAHKPSASGPRRNLLKHLNGWQRDNRHYMLEDITLVDKKHRFEVMHIDEPVPEFALHRCDPISAGLLDFRAKLITNDLGDRFASRVPLIEAAAYLYSAAKAAAARNHNTLCAWPDMEKYLDTYGDDSQFKMGILQAPDSAFAILSNWENVMKALVPIEKADWAIAVAGQKRGRDIGLRISLLSRYSWEEHEAHFEHPTTLFYCQEIMMHRLQIDLENYQSEANSQRILAAARQREANGGPRVGQMPRPSGINDEKPDLAPISMDEANTRELQRKAMLAQLSPLEVLKILDETITSLLEGILSVDYFQLFDESVALLRAVNESYSPAFRSRVAEVGAAPDCFANIPLFIAEDLKAELTEDRTGADILGVLIESVRTFLENRVVSSSQENVALV